MFVLRMLISLCLLLFFAGQLSAAETLTHITVKGRICCQGRGLADILVTDGEFCTLTDGDGHYTLLSDSDKSFVYYTLPSGYESTVEHGLPIFYRRINNEAGDLYVRDFDLIKSRRDQERHAFIVCADPQVRETAELDLLAKVVRDMRETLSGMDPALAVHGICCGDMVFDRPDLFDPYITLMSGAGIPFYHLIGNHDLDYSNITHETSSRTYQAKLGPPYYSFNRGKIHYITLNDVFYYGYSYHFMGYLDQRQLNWLKADLQRVPRGTTIIVSLHIPTRYGESPAKPDLLELQKNALLNAQVVYDLLKGYQVHIMAGHSHEQWNTVISDNILEHVHGAACAAWWQGELGTDGTPGGYNVYEVKGNRLTWYFKAAGRPVSDQFALYPVGSDAAHPDFFIANVYNYDPLWKVYWLENGVRKGEMEQYWGEDPGAKTLYPPGKNKKVPWLSPGQTDHLFKARPTQNDADISVQVIDRFGASYTRALK